MFNNVLCHFALRTGPNKWRDMQLPSEILDSYCENRCLGKPRYNGDTLVRVDHKDYSLDEFGKFSNLLRIPR